MNGVVKWKAIRKICKGGAGLEVRNRNRPLERHVESYLKKEGEMAARQTQLQYNPDGSISHWDYDPERAREEALHRLIASNG